MPEKLKHLFNEGVVRSIAADISPHYQQFDGASFVADCMDGLDDLDLTQRAMHIAKASSNPYQPHQYVETRTERA